MENKNIDYSITNVSNVNPYDEILPNLYLGSVKAFEIKYEIDKQTNKYESISHNISFDTIVNLIKPTTMSDNTIPKCKTFIRIPINDNSDDNDKLLTEIQDTRVLEIIHSSLMKKENVLVHCFAGMSRSCTLVACYLIKYCNMGINESIEYIKSKRPIAFFGGVHFMKTLQNIKKKYTNT